MESKAEQMFISIVTDITFLATSKDWDSEVASLYVQQITAHNYEDKARLRKDIHSRKPKMEFALLSDQIYKFEDLKLERKLLSLITQIISLVSFMDLDSQPKPESELISLIKRIISRFNSKPDSESGLVSLITRTMCLSISGEPNQESELLSLISQLVSLKSKPEFTSLIMRIISRFRAMNWEQMEFISFCPQAYVTLEDGKFRVTTEVFVQREEKCQVPDIQFWRTKRQIFFHCRNCSGENHEGYEKAQVQAKHPLHRQHSLRLVSNIRFGIPRECYCCDKNLASIFYYCEVCDYAMNYACAKKRPPVLSIDHPKRHQHPLAPFPSHDSLTCDLCAIKDSTCPFYVCPPCSFVVHQKCLSLPRVIRISRHPHRISFTLSFVKEDLVCNVCRRKINNDYGGYSCINNGCSYVAHSRCATQSNIWDGIELERVPEEIEEDEEEVEPFVRISQGIIQHFSHEHHPLVLVENTGRDYDEKTLCQACVTPIYFGNFYSCMTCQFILHEKCANLSRKIHHPIHPHMLTLVGGRDDKLKHIDNCSACGLVTRCGFFYESNKQADRLFRLHVQCATISEPLVHGSHPHNLFLTSKPRERRTCSVCKFKRLETFNCIEECDFSLCFRCATIPQKVRYKHDKHILSLCYGEETSTTAYWCETCEIKINPKGRFYKCDEYCCVTLHIQCLIGKDIYMKPGSSGDYDIQPNQRMSRPICSECKMHCPFPIFFEYSGLIFCSLSCFPIEFSLEM